MKVEVLQGLPVVSIADGTVVGHVDALYFEPQQRRLGVLELTAAGQRARIPFAAVHHIGPDAVTIPAVAAVQWLNPTSIPPAQAGLLSLGELMKLRVLDEAGTFLGSIRSVEIDPEDGRISQVQAHHGGVLGIGGTTHTIAGEQIRSASSELMVVALPEKPAPDQSSGAGAEEHEVGHERGER